MLNKSDKLQTKIGRKNNAKLLKYNCKVCTKKGGMLK